MENLDILKTKRKVLKTSSTKLMNTINDTFLNSETQIEINWLEENLALINDKEKQFHDICKDIESQIKDVNQLETELELNQEYREKFVSIKCKLSRKLNEIKKPQEHIHIADLTSALSSINANSNLSSVSQNKIRVNLPKLNIEKFDGNSEYWQEFYSQFKSAIHDNEELNNIDKFTYLKSLLKGSAQIAIQGLTISDENYTVALKILEDRYNKKELLIRSHINKLLNLPPVRSSSNVKELRNLYDTCEIHIRSLSSLGIELQSYGNLLFPIITKLIPDNLMLNYNRENKNETESWNVSKLLKFLKEEIETRERTLSFRRKDCDDYCNYDRKHVYKKDSIEDKSFKDKITFKHNSKDKRSYTASDLVVTCTDKINSNCLFCDSSLHKSMECDNALKLSLEDRKNVLMKKGACFRCLEMKKHISRNCKKNINCNFCSGNHASLLCFKKYNDQTKIESKNSNENTETSLLSYQSFPKTVYLQTLIARVKNQGAEYLVRIILDTASSKSYISKFVAEKLHLKSFGKVQVTHGLFGGSEKIVSHNRYFIILMGLNENKFIKLEVMEQEKICASVPRIKDINCIKELKEKHIFLSDICSRSKDCLFEQDSNEIHILLGADVVGKLLTGKIENLSSGLVAVHTKLGWTAMGKTYDNERDSSLLVLSLYVNEAKITDLWRLDSLGITDPAEKQSKGEVQKLVLKHFEETVTRESDGRYKVSLPWINGHPDILDNKELAEKRLRNNVKSLKSSGLLKEYERVFDEWEEEGIIEKVNIEENSLQNVKVHYLPHRAVIKPQSTTKIRPVFDGSAHVKGSASINDCIEKGPNLIELIPSVLNRFRWGRIGVIADIRKAFLQISLNDRDRDYLRFFWWKDGNPENLIEYKHCRVVFGISSSPFLLAATLAYHLDRAPDDLRDIALKLKESLYVDNCVASVDSLEELDRFRSESRKLLASAKFDLRGWCNNRVETQLIDSGSDSEIPVLGLMWDTEKDTLACDFRNFKLDNDLVTKRSILSLTHRIFDPIGFTCPITLIPKLLLQECWKVKASWDSKLPDKIARQFEKWEKDIHELKNISVPRRLSPLSLSEGKLSLHIFCDASGSAYATCIFLRHEISNEVNCRLVQARSRVAPLKNISIPRLELMACCIGARLADTVIRDLKLENVEKFYWSDSMDVLYWITKEGPWGVFVENRVKEIRKLSSPNSWNFVPGHLNPADLPSRGCSVSSLAKSKWWLGPTWLSQSKENWPKCNVNPNMNTINSEKRKIIVTATNLGNSETKFYNRYSSYTKIIRIIGWIFRFFTNSKSNVNRISGQLNNDELQKAEIVLLKLVQQEHFTNKSDSRLNCLNTVTDSDGILRIKTKIFMRDDDLNFRLPIILPSDSHVVKTLIIWKHNQFGHCGVQFLMNILRENYWILKCRKTVKNVISKCIICQKFASKPPEIIESVLPTNRVKDASIFEIIGMDLAGPLYLKDNSKVWILMITCAVFRAVHLELLTSPSTDNFILGFSRFIARRGRPSIVYCDQGTNFVGAKNLLSNINIDQLKSLNKFAFIEWKFIPPAAPWWGGFWERLIGIMKRILRRILGKSSLKMEEMNTILCEVESIINARPLTYVSESSDDLMPLTPAMFLQEKTEIGIPELNFLDSKALNKKYKYKMKIREDLRNRFRIEYLGSLRQPLFKGNMRKQLKKGDIVIIWTENSKRTDWPLGRIIEIYYSNDNVARSAKVKTSTGVLIRPIKKLCHLELPDPENIPLVTTRKGRVVRPPEKLNIY